MISLQRILFPSDFSELALHALRYAVSFSESYQSELHVLHVVDDASQYWMPIGPNNVPVGPPPEELLALGREEMQRFLKEHLAEPRVPVVSEVRIGRPFMEIIGYAHEREIDMIVMGTHGRSGLRHVLLGSVVEKVVRKSPCPVLTIRQPGRDFVMP